MATRRDLSFDKHINKDILFCVSTNHRASQSALEALDQDRISYNWDVRKVPFYRRSQFNGASTVCVISINRNQYHEARQSISRVDPIYRKRLHLNVM